MSTRDLPNDDSSTPDEIDDGLAFAYGEPTKDGLGQQDPSPSVLDRIGELTGEKPKVSLRDTGEAGHTPILKPLGPDDDDTAGKYMIQGELGRGGVGAVHKGHDQDLGRDVAMKFLHDKYKDEPSILHRFVEEAQIGGQLQHPGIVPVYDLGMSDGRPYFTMKLVKGKTLAQALAERESPASDRRRFLAIFEQICQTMAYAHVRGVVHRDLKPANIMIGSFGEVQVVDWGMGKVLERGGVADEKRAAEKQSNMSVIETVRSSGHGTQSIMGSVMGTPAYMPPEQARGDVEAMDPRSDVFALGAILCEILTGQPPYVGEQDELISLAAMAKLDNAYERLQTCGIGSDLVELTTRCLMPAPAARPQSAEDVAKAIHEHLGAAERRAHEATVRAAALKRTQKFGIVLTVVIAAGLTVSLWFSQAASQSAKSEKDARRLADIRAQEAATARDVAQANLDNFDRLSHVVRLEAAKASQQDLYPAWPTMSDAIRAWLGTDAMGLIDAVPELRATLAELEAKALPHTDEDKAEARGKYPRAAELATLENKLAALQYARDVRSGTVQPKPFALDEAALPKDHREWNNLAWDLVDPERQEFGRESEGLAIARRAVSMAPKSGGNRAVVTGTLAWALFANGLDEEALTSSKAALAAAPMAEQAKYANYLKKLQDAIAAASGTKSAQALDDLTVQVAKLDAEVSARTTWRFEDDADGFLHSTLRQLVTEIEAFEQEEVSAVKMRLTWSEHVAELTTTRHKDRWNEARLAVLKADGVTASKLYGEAPIELTPQIGLVPIGMNPKTLLWEFYHLRSAWDGKADPATIALPEHREDGSIDVTGDTGIVFVLLPGATFTMGAQNSDPTGTNYDEQAQADETPRKVEVEPFLLARHELTQGQWARLWSGDASLRRPSYYGSEFQRVLVDESHPVEQVNWLMSTEIMVRHGLALPTEAQWEYGCRGTTSTPYSFEFAKLLDFANVADATAKRAGVPWGCEEWSDGHVVHAPVGTFAANPFGLHDMHGNVPEWCKDLHGNSSFRVYRGGGFNALAFHARSAIRFSNRPTIRSALTGLRPARTLRLRD